MEAGADQVISTTAAVAGLCYGLGILALLWVVRRTIFRERRRARQPKPDEQRRQARQARDSIAGIENRYWLSRFRRAQRFTRGAAPSREQLEFLAAVSAAQGRRREP